MCVSDLIFLTLSLTLKVENRQYTFDKCQRYSFTSIRNSTVEATGQFQKAKVRTGFVFWN